MWGLGAAEVLEDVVDCLGLGDERDNPWTRRGFPSAEPSAPIIAAAAADEDLVIFPPARYCLRPPAHDAIVLGYGGLSPERIRDGIQRLSRVLDRCLANGVGAPRKPRRGRHGV